MRNVEILVMTWAERVVRRLITAQEEGRLEQKFGVSDVRRVYPECPSWVLSDHRRGNPEGRSVWFIQDETGLYSIVPSVITGP